MKDMELRYGFSYKVQVGNVMQNIDEYNRWESKRKVSFNDIA